MAKGRTAPGDGGDDAEIAVIFAGIAHRIDMRTEQQCLGGLAGDAVGLDAADHGAKRIDMHLHAGLDHPGRHHVGGIAMRLRQRQARQHVGIGAELRQRLDARHQGLARGLDEARDGTHCGNRSASRSAAMRSIWLSAVSVSASTVLPMRCSNPARICSFVAPFTAMMKGKLNLLR